ncbi:protein mono-ADP-ribosyltransferase PARP3-like [Haliotis rubra]|uniref:protein mono-ADP-ribosyltransferase PARP3-like n=1 Tax=Haliotis rubra TaxID=36100 RepID=UPI001EE59624|nr:protein mono-ADP-ribosyltransferase PARP3-like [Haliotis rubra]XP_046545135.1 protein mono-ADP-ribosyltransferase PARP3-like [Haliotis rubra]XP_046545143.1 protein mono-ADP-ribosyltransferase PARP3-like [Haliotis rubra]
MATNGEEEADTWMEFIEKLKAVDGGKKKSPKPDSYIKESASYEVVEDYDCMLNQTNIQKNNNKYYVIQVLTRGGKYYTWTRWDRVGESNRNCLNPHKDRDAAVTDFEEKFKEKTKNTWANRHSFEPKPEKYTLIEMANDEEEDVPVVVTSGRRVEEASLVESTQKLENLSLDTGVNMPLGKLSKAQRAKGFEVLNEIEEELEGNQAADKLRELSSRFYTVIPHAYARQIHLPSIADSETLQKKMDMLAVLGDIELLQSLQKVMDITAMEIAAVRERITILQQAPATRPGAQ